LQKKENDVTKARLGRVPERILVC